LAACNGELKPHGDELKRRWWWWWWRMIGMGVVRSVVVEEGETGSWNAI